MEVSALSQQRMTMAHVLRVLAARSRDERPTRAWTRRQDRQIEVFSVLVTAKELSESLAELNQFNGTLSATAVEQAAEIDDDKQDALNRIFSGLAVDPNKAMNVNELDRRFTRCPV